MAEEEEEDDDDLAATLSFVPKLRWEVKNHPLSGLTVAGLAAVLARFGGAVDWLRYGHRVAFLALMAALNTVGALCDRVLYGAAVDAVQLRPDPVFVLGHPRTGTTHLHNLMSKDSGRFAVATTFCVGFPSGFLSMEWMKPAMRPMLSATRPMDNMALTWDLPQEDELGTSQLCGGISPYMAICLMRRWPTMRRWFAFAWDDAKGEDAEYRAWEATFLHFCKKVAYRASLPRHGGCGDPSAKRLLLKSPVHTARIAILRRLFPQARFVCVHRNPYVVWQSAANMADKYYFYSYLDSPAAADVARFILEQYEIIHEAYCRDADALPAGVLHEVAFADLDARPVDTLRGVYAALGLGGEFEGELAAAVSEYAGSLADFRKNAHQPLRPAAVRAVRTRWAAAFARWGYDPATVP